MSALPAALVPMLSKLIPLLASDKDGEVVATAHAISRVLKASGCDWHDLVARLCGLVTPSPNADWRRETRFCFENADLLDERELNFITNIAWSRRKPTERQMQWLRDIADRLRGPA